MVNMVKAVAMARRPVDEAFGKLAKVWETLGLTAEETAERIFEIETKLEAVIAPLLMAERETLERHRGEIAAARAAAQALALELGEKPLQWVEATSLQEQLADARRDLKHLELMRLTADHRLSKEVESLREFGAKLGEQLRLSTRPRREDLRAERERLKKIGARRAEEVSSLFARIAETAERMGLDLAPYEQPSGVEGVEALRDGNAKLRALSQIEADRVAEAQLSRARVRKLIEQLGEPLEFRLAREGEQAAAEDGVCVLDNCEESRQFLVNAERFARTQEPSVLASAEFEEYIQSVEDRYWDALDHESKKLDSNHRQGLQDRSAVHLGSKGARLERKAVRLRPPSARRPERTGVGGAADGDWRGMLDSLEATNAEKVKDRTSGGKRARSRSPRSDHGRRGSRSPRSGNGSRGGGGRGDSRSDGVRSDSGGGRKGSPGEKSRLRASPERDEGSEMVEATPGSKDSRAFLKHLAGEWADSAGTRYTISAEKAMRDDGKCFELILDRGRIEWTRKAKFFLDPSTPAQDKVEWMCARSLQPAFAWTRAASVASPTGDGSEAEKRSRTRSRGRASSEEASFVAVERDAYGGGGASPQGEAS